MGPAFKTTRNKSQAKTNQRKQNKIWGQIKKIKQKHGPFI